MAKGKSRLQPQHQFWFEDLPRRGEPRSVDPDIYDDFNSVTETFLEVSRVSSIVRGAGFVFALAGVVGLLVMFAEWIPGLIADFARYPIAVSFTWLMMLALTAIVIHLGRLDLSIPSDRPVRFNRKQRKIYAYEYQWTWNPFGRWPATVKVFDWDNVQAEINLQRGFSGKVYVERYALSLAHCKPGTDEVVDRIDLWGNAVLTHGLRAMWSYCCQYMDRGLDGLPAAMPRPQDVRFTRCLFSFVPWLDPTSEGREYRRSAHWVIWLLALILLPVSPLLLLLGLGNYVVMRLAPEPKWPTEINAESRSA